MESAGQLIFVYGSLKRGYRLHRLLAGQEFLGAAQTASQYRMFDLGEYPGLTESDDGVSVTGEVYRVTAECLLMLDDVEDVGAGMYARRRVCLAQEFTGAGVDAWFWLRSVSGCRDCGSSWPAA